MVNRGPKLHPSHGLGFEVELSCPVGNLDEAIPPVETGDDSIYIYIYTYIYMYIYIYIYSFIYIYIYMYEYIYIYIYMYK